ncbi:hypothetical protein [Paenibacillus solani]|uniref:hypothetical protein n=1 Tax=Paenibacillus solani TaxID=1705565 RepID=UPI003D2E5E0E
MATVSSTLQLFDSMSGPIKSIVSSMDMMLSTMNELQKAAGQDTSMESMMVTAQQSITQTETILNQLTDTIMNTAQEQEHLNSVISEMANVNELAVVEDGYRKMTSQVEEAVHQQEQLDQLMKGSPDLQGVQNAENEISKMGDAIEQVIQQQTRFNSIFGVVRSLAAGTAVKVTSLGSAFKRAYTTARNKIEELNQSMSSTSGLLSGMTSKLMAFAGAYMGISAVKGFLGQSSQAATDQITAEQRLQSIMSNINGMTQDGIDLVKNYAKELEATGKTAINAGAGITGLSQLAEYVYDPQVLKDMTRSMYDLATETYGVNVSADQLTQTANLMGKVMMGDINALSRNGFKIDAIFDEAQQKVLKFGTEAERAALVIEMIDENLQGLSESMANTPEGKLVRLQNLWGGIQEKVGYLFLDFKLQMAEIAQDLLPDVEKGFIKAFSAIFKWLSDVVKMVVRIYNFTVENWPTIEAVLWGIVAAVAAWRLAQIGVNIAMAANPVGLIIMAVAALIGVIVLLVKWFINLWNTNDEFVENFIRGWNSVLNFFDQVPVFFTKVGVGIANAFHDAKVESLKALDQMVNGAVDKINGLIEKLNKLNFVSIDFVDGVVLSASAQIEAEAARQAGEAKIAAAEAKATGKAEEREAKLQEMMKGRAEKRAQKEKELEKQLEELNAGKYLTGLMDPGTGVPIIPSETSYPDEIKKVKQVDKVKGKVDISSDDLKIMRELAEMKNIQYFNTLKPTISIKTGNINNSGDLDSIVTKLTTRLEDEIASSAKGVYE